MVWILWSKGNSCNVNDSNDVNDLLDAEGYKALVNE